METNKARRHELKMLHYKKRLKNYCIKDNGTGNLYAFRSHGKPCSCRMCRSEKYRDKRKTYKLRQAIFIFLMFVPIFSFAQTDPVKDSLENMVSELAKPVYIETYKTVSTAKFKIKMAIVGTKSVKEAMDYYNENLAAYMGSYKTLASVKKRLDDAGDAFVKFRYLKEKARIAKLLAEKKQEEITEMQAEESFEAEKKKQ